MKLCPQCSASYDDGVRFCAKDGRSLQSTTTAPSRLCPHCANSIAVSAAQCPYCKGDTAAEPTPQWLIRDEPTSQPKSTRRTTVTPFKIMFITATAVCLLAAVLWAAGFMDGDTSAATRRLLDDKIKELQTKEKHLKSLEAELAKARQELDANAKNGEALKLQLEQSQKAREAAEVRVNVLGRELERRNAHAAKPQPNIERRLPERAASSSTPGVRSAKPGVYETTRATEVHEQPAESSRVLSRIGKGTRINVARANGDWLEVVSRRGNPPGFVLRNDAMLVTASN